MDQIAERRLGRTELRVSCVSFGAGPVPGAMTAADNSGPQRALIARAIERGINWFDTAATYGSGRSEESLGALLAELDPHAHLHVATKVRLDLDSSSDIAGQIRQSLQESLARLRRPGVTLLQLHNSITKQRGELPTSVTPGDVLGPGGVLQTFRELQPTGLVRCLGLTGLGQAAALREVINSGEFDTIQIPYNLLNATAGSPAPAGFVEDDYQQLLDDCARADMGVLAIRVFAGGALAGQPPSDHTRTTKFFPLSLYERDAERAARLASRLPEGLDLREAAVRFVLGDERVSTALIGLSQPEQIDAAARFAQAGPLPENVWQHGAWLS